MSYVSHVLVDPVKREDLEFVLSKLGEMVCAAEEERTAYGDRGDTRARLLQENVQIRKNELLQFGMVIKTVFPQTFVDLPSRQMPQTSKEK
eukprot:gene13186-9449_t